MNDDDRDDEAIDGIIAEGVARTVDPLAARLDAKDRSALSYLATGRCTVECTCHFKVSARSTETMIAAYRDHTQFAHGQCLPVIQ